MQTRAVKEGVRKYFYLGLIKMAGTPAVPLSTTPITATPAARAFVSHVSEASRLALAQRRPWVEMVDKNSFAKPENFSDALTRIRKNLGYFRINYIIFVLALVGLSLITHVFSLFTLAVIVLAWAYLYMVRRDPLVLWGRTFTEREVLAIMTVLTITALLLTNVGSLLISSVLLGSAIIAAHGAFRVPDDLFLDDQEGSMGFLSFLGTGAPQPPAVVSHV